MQIYYMLNVDLNSLISLPTSDIDVIDFFSLKIMNKSKNIIMEKTPSLHISKYYISNEIYESKKIFKSDASLYLG